MTAKYDKNVPAEPGIYRIRNLADGKLYLGSSVNLRVRKYHHFWHLKRGTHVNSKLQRAFRKHGETAFVFEIVEQELRKEVLVQREQFWLDHVKPFGSAGYNLALTAGSMLGYRHSEDSKIKMSLKQRGSKRPPVPEERRLRIAESLKGRAHSEERKQKIRDARARQLVRHSEETRRKLSEAAKSRVYTEDGLRALSEKAKARGAKPPPQAFDALRKKLTGVPRSQEVRDKISASHRARKARLLAEQEGTTANSFS